MVVGEDVHTIGYTYGQSRGKGKTNMGAHMGGWKSAGMGWGQRSEGCTTKDMESTGKCLIPLQMPQLR